MRRKLVIAALTAVALAIVAGAYTLADTVGDDGGASTHASLIIDRPPTGGGCVCPALWQPVVCTRENPDGTTSHQAFSNGCVAACHGYTSCARIVLGP
jgi:hypothetical protein